MSRRFLIIGGTGHQGSAVLHALDDDLLVTDKNNEIYAIYHKQASGAALRNKYPNIKLIQGDVNDSTAIFRAVGPAPDVLYFMTISEGKDEVKQGKAIISAAVKAGTKHIVMSSIDRGPGGNVFSGVDIWDTKHEIEAFLRKQTTATYTIIRPAAFLENFSSDFISSVYASVWRDCHAKMAVVSTKDIGITVVKAMMAPEDYRNAEINLAGDDLTYEEASQIFAKVTGKKKLPAANKHLTSMLVAMMSDLKQMVVFYKEKGTGATVDPDLMSWEAYIRQSAYMKS
ncbi:hypothetical protein BGZ60DRAFT_422661 [Tricladium varicosporioides]|nr:hypothetical protein BGZ60DRAFT_422661 [Hymenoscyphus varicosporioides]